MRVGVCWVSKKLNQRPHETSENVDPRRHVMGEAATPKGEGFSRRRFRHGGSRPPPLHRPRSRQSLCCCRGRPLPRNFRPHL